ncbi:hypothetical protein Scep_001467 [Stephania cephalantha]|uniref:DUF1985 domain-containing protein n=1 Tax=Stephania cephalantha TaxID=152367 RepID=A0AAP0L8G1_9MAGN
MVEKSCFGDLILKLPKTHLFGHIIHNLLLREGVASKSDAMAVVIGDNANIFYAYQFHKIIGLTIGSTSFPENKQDINKSSIIKEFFGGNHMIKRTELDEVYKGSNTTNDKLFLRLTLVYFLELALMGKDEKTNVDTNILAMVDNLKKCNKFSWGSYVYQMTIESLKKPMKAWIAMKKPKQKCNNIARFSYALVWAYEVVIGLSKLYASIREEYVEGAPTIFK